MKISALTGMLCVAASAASPLFARDTGWVPPAKPAASEASAKTGLAEKIGAMPAKTRKSMSSVVGFSPIYDVEKIPLRAKDLYRITYDRDGRRDDVFIDEFGAVQGEPGLK